MLQWWSLWEWGSRKSSVGALDTPSTPPTIQPEQFHFSCICGKSAWLFIWRSCLAAPPPSPHSPERSLKDTGSDLCADFLISVNWSWTRARTGLTPVWTCYDYSQALGCNFEHKRTFRKWLCNSIAQQFGGQDIVNSVTSEIVFPGWSLRNKPTLVDFSHFAYKAESYLKLPILHLHT